MAVRQLQVLTDAIKSHLGKLKLKINAAKTVLIIFSRKHAPSDNLYLTVDEHHILPTSHTKLLGLILDSKLNWSAHLNEKDRQVRKIFFSLRSYAGRTWGLSGTRLGALYKALVEPSLLYCCSVWASAIKTKHNRKKLRQIERQFNILISKSFKTADSGALSVLTGSLPVDYRVLEITLRRLLMSKLQTFSPYAQQASETLLPDIDKILRKEEKDARQRLQHPFTHSGRPPSQIKKAIRTVLGNLWSKEWSESSQGNTTRSFFPSPSCFTQLSSHNLPHQVIQILSGHSYLNVHQHRLKLLNSPSCACSSQYETTEHFIFDCPLFANLRVNFIAICLSELSLWPPPISKIHTSTKAFKELCKFILTSDRLSPPRKHTNQILA